MEIPPRGAEVLVTLANKSVIIAYWLDGNWWQGIENDPNDWLVETEVISWQEKTD